MDVYIGVRAFSLSGYRYPVDGGRREIFLDNGTYRHRTESLPCWGRCPQGSPKSYILCLNFGHLTANLGNGKSQRYMSIRG